MPKQTVFIVHVYAGDEGWNLVETTERGAFLQVKHVIHAWISYMAGGWDNYTPEEVVALREAIEAGNVDDTISAWHDMDYGDRTLSVVETEILDTTEDTDMGWPA